jgi:ketosteroid isomerase-like protein
LPNPNGGPVAFAGSAASCIVPTQTDREHARQTLLTAQQTYSVIGSTRGAVAAFKAMAAEDLRYLQQGQPILFGRDAMLHLMQSDAPTASSTQTWHPVRAEVSADGRRGYTFGYTHTAGPSGARGATTSRSGKYIAFWRRRADGTWHAIAYLHNFQPAVTEREAPPAQLPSPDEGRGSFPSPDPGELLAEVEHADQAFAANALDVGPPEAFYNYAAEDGAMLSAEPSIVFGRPQIRAALAAFPTTGQLLWRPVDGDVAGSGDLGFTVGLAEIRTVATDGSPQVTFTKYLTVWKRANTGEWRFAVDGGNARPER